jgi:hypothetical protein
MNDAMLWIGRAAGVVGLLLCAVAVVARFAGQYFVAGYQVGTMLQAGTAAMIAGCLAFLWVLSGRFDVKR